MPRIAQTYVGRPSLIQIGSLVEQANAPTIAVNAGLNLNLVHPHVLEGFYEHVHIMVTEQHGR